MSNPGQSPSGLPMSPGAGVPDIDTLLAPPKTMWQQAKDVMGEAVTEGTDYVNAGGDQRQPTTVPAPQTAPTPTPVLAPAAPAPTFNYKQAPGMVEAGNLDPWNRPVLHNPSGSYSTTSSISVGTDKGETVIPTVVNGVRLSNADAITHYKKTGENLGTFSSVDQANAFAINLHNVQATMYDQHGNPAQQAVPDIDDLLKPPTTTGDYLRAPLDITAAAYADLRRHIADNQPPGNPAMDHYLATTEPGKLLATMGRGTLSVWNRISRNPDDPEDLGTFLEKAGLLDDYDNRVAGTTRAFNQAVLAPSAMALDAFTKAKAAIQTEAAGPGEIDEAARVQPVANTWFAKKLSDFGTSVNEMYNMFGSAFTRGAVEGTKALVHGATGTMPEPGAPDTTYMGKLLTDESWAAKANPRWYAAQVGYTLGHMAAPLAAAGATAAAVAGLPEEALAGITVAGASLTPQIAATATGAVALVAKLPTQQLPEAYTAARQRGLSHEAAVNDAIVQTHIGAAWNTLMTLVPGLKPFGETAKGELGNLLLHTFGTFPAMAVAQTEAEGLREGRQPTASELASGGITAVAMAPTFFAPHLLSRGMSAPEYDLHAIYQRAKNLGLIGDSEDDPDGPGGPDAQANAIRKQAAYEQEFDKEHHIPTDKTAPEQAVTHAPPEPLDIHQTARAIDPVTFEQYDPLRQRHDILNRKLLEDRAERARDPRLQAAQDEIDRIVAKSRAGEAGLTNRQRDQIADIRGGMQDFLADEEPLLHVKQAIAKNYQEMADLAPQVRAAYRAAEERMAQTSAEAGAAQPAAAVPPAAAPEPAQAVPTSDAARAEIPEVQQRNDTDATRIADDIYKKLTKAGWPADQASDFAATHAAYFVQRARRFGYTTGTPYELYAQEGPNVFGPERGILANQPVFAQRTFTQDHDYPLAPVTEWHGDANYKETGGHIDWMTPDEFLSRVRPLEIDDVSRENIDNIKAHIVSGKTLDPLALYENGKEDGRHRAVAAKEVGIAEVPVLSWKKQFFQGAGPEGEGIRGAIAIGKGVRASIYRTRLSDASTYLHEMYHDFLQALKRDAAHPQAPADIVADYKTVRDSYNSTAEGRKYPWTGDAIPERAHEWFARGGERHAMEGAVPSEALRPVFQRFKEWFTEIYKTVGRLKAPISPAMREVYNNFYSFPEERPVVASPRIRKNTIGEEHEATNVRTEPKTAAVAADKIREQQEERAENAAPKIHQKFKTDTIEIPTGTGQAGGVAAPHAYPAGGANAAGSLAADAGDLEGHGVVPAGGNQTAQEGAELGGAAGSGGGPAAGEYGAAAAGAVPPGAGERGAGGVGGLREVQGTGEVHPRRVAQRSEENAIAAGLSQAWGNAPEYAQLNRADQIKGAVRFMNDDWDAAVSAALGRTNPPADLHPESIFIAVENRALAKGDIDLLQQLARESTLVKEGTIMGQRISMWAERNPSSPVAMIQKLQIAKDAAAKPRAGEALAAKAEQAPKLKAALKNALPNAAELKSFLDDIRCT